MQKIKLRRDSRDIHFNKNFGSIQTFPLEMEFDAGLTNVIEAANEVDCTAISSTDVATDQTKIVYDIDDLWSLVPKTLQGADPRDTLGVMCKQGLLPKDGGERDKRWSSYLRGETGPLDAFDNVRSAMLLARSSITVATNWYSNWNVSPENVLPIGVGRVSSHDYKISGWKQINGEPMFHVKAWLGFYVYMPRETFNDAISRWGCGAYLPTTNQVTVKAQVSVLQKILDSLVNVLLAFKETLKKKT